MRIHDMNWMQVEACLQSDDRCVLPLGSTEQHGYLRLTVDCILPERVSVEAAEPLGVPVFPVFPYGITPYFAAFPGTVSLTPATHAAVVREFLEGVSRSGFRRILIVNGHGGNSGAERVAADWVAGRPGCQVRFHNWWKAPRTWACVQEIDPVASHASWMENFPWTRLEGIATPMAPKPMSDTTSLHDLAPADVRTLLGDGNFGGRYVRSDDDMLRLWRVAVAETRDVLEHGWSPGASP